MGFPRHDLFSKRQRKVSDFSRILSHPIRIEIIEYLLTSGPVCVQELMKNIPLSNASVSRHLSVLRNAALVDYEESHPYIYYEIRHDQCAILMKTLRNFTDFLETEGKF